MNTRETRQVIDELGIVPLKADKTHAAPEADALLQALGNQNKSIPFYAIFPAGRPNEPILLDGVFLSPKPVLDALRQAGSSQQDE